MSFSDVFGSLGNFGSGLAVLAGAAGEGGEDERRRVAALWERLQTPNFDMRSLTAPELRLVAEYFPEHYQAHVGEVSLTADSPEMRRRFGEGLDYVEGVRDRGLPLSEELAAREAQRQVGRSHRRAIQGSMEDLEARGRAGGGAEAALRAEAAGQAAELARGYGSDLASLAERTRYQAAGDAAQLAHQGRMADVGVSSQRAGELNRYNDLVATLLTRQAQDNARASQEAQWANATLRNDIQNRNELARYDTERENLTRQNALTQQGFGNQVTRLSGLSGALGDVAHGRDAEQAATRDTIMGVGQAAGRAVGGGLDLAFPGFSQGSEEDEERRKRMGG